MLSCGFCILVGSFIKKSGFNQNKRRLFVEHLNSKFSYFQKILFFSKIGDYSLFCWPNIQAKKKLIQNRQAKREITDSFCTNLFEISQGERILKRRRGYLKHWNDSTAGLSFQALLMKKRPYSILIFWYILERCNQLNSPSISINITELRSRFHRRSDALLTDILKLSEDVSTFAYTLVGDNLEITISNYAEYQESRGGKRDSNHVAKVSPLKIKDQRLKIKDTKFKIPDDWIDEAYSVFPRKEGRSKGYEKLKATIKSKDHWNEFVGALENYIKKIDAENPEIKHIKLFSTFVNSWEDYLSKNFTPPKKNAAPTGITVIRQQNGN